VRFRNCSEALEALAKGLDRETCHDFRAIRQVVMCKAWHGNKEEPFTPDTFEKRVEEAWEEVRKVCEPHGGIEPQFGFLPSQRIEDYLPPQSLAKVTAVKEVTKNGVHAGVIVEEDNHSVTLCLDSGNEQCGTLTPGAGIMENLTIALKIAGYEVKD